MEAKLMSEVIISALSSVTVAVIGLLVFANLTSIVLYAFHQRRLVERLQRRIMSVTSLLRLGIR